MAEIKYNLGTLSVVPTGAVVPFAGSRAPVGYLLCDGSEVSRTDYPYLFDTIGTAYGEGDGLTTFNLPNLQDKFIQGSSGTNTVGTIKEAGLPNITGSVLVRASGSDSGEIISSQYGAFSIKNGTSWQSLQRTSTNGYGDVLEIDASKSNSIYGNSNTVQPPSIVMNYIIKY